MKKITILMAFISIGTIPLFGQWVTVGNNSFSDSIINNVYQDLAVDYAGIPYVAYQNATDSGKIAVMKYNGSGWVRVGSELASSTSMGSFFAHPKIAFDSSNSPYVGYVDNSRLTVASFNGTSWIPVGSPAFTDSVFRDNFDFGIDPAGVPYVAYAQYSKGEKITVMKYAFSNWNVVGSAGFSDSVAEYISIAFDNIGTPYVQYADSAQNLKATIQKFTGSGVTGWQIIGTPGFSYYNAPTNRGSLVIGKNNNPCMAYYDTACCSSTMSVIVAQYNGIGWGLDTLDYSGNGNGSFGTRPKQIRLAVDGRKNPFISYVDNHDAGYASTEVYTVRRYDSIIYASPLHYWAIEGEPTTYNGITVHSNVYSNSPLYLALDNSSNPPIPYVAFLDSGNKLTVKKYLCQSSTVTTEFGSSISNCSGKTINLSFFAVPNDAEYWQWYSGSCGGTPVGSGQSLNVTDMQVAPTDTTTYFVRGEGYCPVSDSCASFTVNVLADSIPTVSIMAIPGDTICHGTTVVFSAASTYGGNTPSYKWYKNGIYLGCCSFQYTDNSLNNGDTIQCVLISDATGCINPDTAVNKLLMTVNVCSGVVSITKDSLVIHPNPTQGQFFIESELIRSENVMITIRDLTGKKIEINWSKEGNQASLNTSTLSPGVYVVTLSDGHNSCTGKIVKL